MKKALRTVALLMALMLVAAACGSDDAGGDLPDEINVAYFAEWPTPNQFGQADGSFGDAVGATINWIPFSSGGDMAQAMEGGSIDIAYSQGLTPFANFVNNGSDLKLVGIAVAYAEADNCVAQGSLGANRDNAATTLAGAKIMTPIGNVTHYKMLSMMDFLGVSGLEVIPAEGGASTAAAFESGQIDVGCAFGGAVETMLAAGGNLIMTGAEHENDIGIFTYDVVAIPTSFGEQFPQAVTNFLRATDEFNSAWAADMEGQNPTIATAAGMTDVGSFLGGPIWFSFPTVEEQLSDTWLGGTVAEAMKGQLQTFFDLGEIEDVMDDFSVFIDTSYLEAIEG